MASSPFSRAVFESMRTLYPECLADKTFDNTGLLLEAPWQPSSGNKNSVLLTIDLTSAVADEAIAEGHSVVVAYHPIIFRGLKSITLQDSQQRSLLRLAAHGVSVYSPHTAVDTVPGGMADWLGDIVTGAAAVAGGAIGEAGEGDDDGIGGLTVLPHTRSVVTASPADDIEAANRLTGSTTAFSPSNTGAGRLITFARPQALRTLARRIGRAVGNARWMSLAVPQSVDSVDEVLVSTVGVCPGSGTSVLRACRPAPDLIVTGEMSHHDALAVTERGGAVLTLFHSNSERGYLSAVMRARLEDALRGALPPPDADTVSVRVSGRDRDPFVPLAVE